jgi:hypothetical protein
VNVTITLRRKGGGIVARWGYLNEDLLLAHEAEEERRRKLHDGVLDEWKKTAQNIKAENESMLQKEARREAMFMIEDAARTEKEYNEVTILWDCIETVESWRLAKQEPKRTDILTENVLNRSETIIPAPINHIWWRELFKGSFIDVIFDCPYEIQELTSSRPVYDLIKGLEEKQKEILYYLAIRLWTPQRIAVMRGQTDRNIRKVYSNMIDDIRIKLYKRLYPRYEAFLPLTVSQVAFVERYINEYGVGVIRGKHPMDNSADGGEDGGV